MPEKKFEQPNEKKIYDNLRPIGETILKQGPRSVKKAKALLIMRHRDATYKSTRLTLYLEKRVSAKSPWYVEREFTLEGEEVENLHTYLKTVLSMTEEKFVRVPDEGSKFELVNGEVQEVPRSVRNDEIAAIVIYRLTPAVIGRGALCSSRARFRMPSGNVRTPDVSFTRRERLPGGIAPDTFGDAAPDLCVEIVSPSEEPTDIARNQSEYFASGAQQVWYLFPETRCVVVYTSPMQCMKYMPEQEITGGDLLPAFRCYVADLFELIA